MKKKYCRTTTCTAFRGISTPTISRPYNPRKRTIPISVSLSVNEAPRSVSGVDMTSHKPQQKLMSWFTLAAADTNFWYPRYQPDTFAAAPATCPPIVPDLPSCCAGVT